MAADGFTTRPVYMGTHGVIASGHYLAARAGQRMFDKGGNAIDALVATGFALNLLKPHLNGLGGEVPILVYSASDKKVFSISGQGFIGKAATVDWFRKEGIDLIPGDGFLPACVPAMFGSWAFALMRFGTLTLKDVLGPAIDYAESGFPVYPGLRHAVAGLAERFRTEWPSSAAVYLPNDRVPAVGDVFKNPDFAAVLKKAVDVEAREAKRGREAAIQSAIDYWYKGEVASAIVDFMKTPIRDASGKKHAGLLTTDDFTAWQPKLEEPVTIDYHGLSVYKCGPWTQGPVFLQQLRLLEGFNLEKMGHNTATYVHTVVEAAKLAYADREFYYGDPDFVKVPLKLLLSKDYAKKRRELIDPKKASLEMRPGHGPASEPEDVKGKPETFRGDTTHTCAVDAAGNMVAATCSGGWLMSSPVVPGLGFPMGTRGQMFRLDPHEAERGRPAPPAADHVDPVPGAEGRQAVHGVRHAGRRPAGPMDAAILPELRRFRHELARGDRRAELQLHALPEFVLPARGDRWRPGGGEPHPRGDAQGTGSARPQGAAAGDWSNGLVMAVQTERKTGVISGAVSPRAGGYVMGVVRVLP